MVSENSFNSSVKQIVKAREIKDSDEESLDEIDFKLDALHMNDDTSHMNDDMEDGTNHSDSTSSSSTSSANDINPPKLSIFGSTWTFLNQIITPSTRTFLSLKSLEPLKTTVTEQKRIEIFNSILTTQLQFLKRKYRLEQFDLQIIKTLDLSKISSVIVVRVVCALFSTKLMENRDFKRSEFLKDIGLDEMQFDLLSQEL
jgi:hypothetical protein